MVTSARRSATAATELNAIRTTENVTAKKDIEETNVKQRALQIDTVKAARRFVAVKTEANVIQSLESATALRDILDHCKKFRKSSN